MWVNSIIAVILVTLFLFVGLAYAVYSTMYCEMEDEHDLGAEYDPEPEKRFKVSVTILRFSHMLGQVVEYDEKRHVYFNSQFTIHENTVLNGSINVEEI